MLAVASLQALILEQLALPALDSALHVEETSQPSQVSSDESFASVLQLMPSEDELAGKPAAELELKQNASAQFFPMAVSIPVVPFEPPPAPLTIDIGVAAPLVAGQELPSPTEQQPGQESGNTSHSEATLFKVPELEAADRLPVEEVELEVAHAQPLPSPVADTLTSKASTPPAPSSLPTPAAAEAHLVSRSTPESIQVAAPLVPLQAGSREPVITEEQAGVAKSDRKLELAFNARITHEHSEAPHAPVTPVTTLDEQAPLATRQETPGGGQLPEAEPKTKLQEHETKGEQAPDDASLPAEFLAAPQKPHEGQMIAPAMTQSQQSRQPESARLAPSPVPQPVETSSLQENKPAAPVRNLSLQLETPDTNQRVDVRLVERAGTLHVAVRSNSPELAHSLRESAPELVANLAERGFKSDLSAEPASLAEPKLMERLDSPRADTSDSNPDRRQDAQLWRDDSHGRKRQQQHEDHWEEQIWQ